MPQARAMRTACAGAACRPPLRRGREDRAVALPAAGAHALNGGKPQCARVRPQAPDRRPCLLPRRVRWRDRVRHLRRHELATQHLRRWQLASCRFPSDCFDHLSPAASEPRHDGADRHTGHLGYLPISEPLDIAQYQGFPVGRWQSAIAASRDAASVLAINAVSGVPRSKLVVPTCCLSSFPRSSTTISAEGRLFLSQVKAVFRTIVRSHPRELPSATFTTERNARRLAP